MGWTERQKQAIDFRENRDLLVAAAAGSGKTSVMVERVIRLILEGEAGIDEMLAVTFTRAAASSMKEKIVSRLRDQIAEDVKAGRQENVERLKSQLGLVHDACISTFDSFAQKIVRENFQAIDTDPGAGVCDEAKSEILKNRALDEMLEAELAKAEPGFVEFMDSYADVKSFESVKDKIWSAYQTIMALPDPFGKLYEAAEVLNLTTDEFLKSNAFKAIIDDLRMISSGAKQRVEKVKAILSEPVLAPLKAKFEPEMAGLAELDSKLEAFFSDADSGLLCADSVEERISEIRALYAAVKESMPRWQATGAMGTDCKSAFDEEFKEKGKPYRDEYKKDYAQLVEKYFYQPIEASLSEARETYPKAKEFCRLVQEFHNRFMAKKEEIGAYDFTDFIHFALKALENEDVAQQYKSRFKYIFVDEYQDSNELQEELIKRISRGGNIFMVGDVKQSIYRFRQAEPSLFKNRYKAYKGSGEGYNPGSVIDLNSNFRSKVSVINAANDLFEEIMEDYDSDARLYPGSTAADTDNAEPLISIVDMMDNDTETAATEFEARNIAAIIKKKLAADSSLCYRDIAVLMSSYKSYADAFKDVFESEGIPLFIEEEKGYFDAVEVEIVLNLLRVIDNIRQDVPLISVLYSPAFGFTCEELAKIRILRENRYDPFYEAFLECAQSDESVLAKKCSSALLRIRQWRAESMTMPLPDFIWKLYRETGIYIFMGALPGGTQRRSNLRMLVSRAIAYSKEESGIYNFLLEIERMQSRNINVPPAGLVGESADAVRIMTIHKSKGLEYPCVILAGAHKEVGRSYGGGEITFNKSIGIALPFMAADGSFKKKTIIEQAINYQNSKEEVAEKIRLLYVAFTRAIKHLAITGCSKDVEKDFAAWADAAPLCPAAAYGGRSFFDWIMPALGQKIKTEIVSLKELEDASEIKEESALQMLAGAEKLSVRDEISKRLAYEYPFMEDVRGKSKYSVSEINFESERKPLTLEVPAALGQIYEREGLDAEDAGERGTIYHKIMELIDFRDTGTCKPAEIFDELLKKGFVSGEGADRVEISEIEAFLRSDLAGRMSAAARAGKLWKEAPFTLQIEREGRNILVQGIIDCYFEEDGPEGKRFILADYKTNYVAARNEDVYNHFRDMYKKQIDLYTEAIEKLRGGKVAERYLILLSAGEAISL